MKNQVQFSISVSKTRAILLFTIKIIETFELHASIPGMWSAEYQTTIGQLHDDVILLQLPESLSLLFSCAN